MAQQYLEFRNKGVLDIMGLLLMGASTKRGNDEMIGEYGSGWKYAIAALLRFNVPFFISTGGRSIDVRTREVKLRDKPFRMITIEGQDANFTTELGPEWQLWMAVREIYCNAIDEGGNTIRKVNKMEVSKPDETIIYLLISDELAEVIDRWMHYFAFERTDDIFYAPKRVRVFNKITPGSNSPSIIYRRGIKVAESKGPGCFDYDFYNIPINELREAKNFEDVKDKLNISMRDCMDSNVIQAILKSEGTWEKRINFYEWEKISNTEAWNSVIGDSMIVPDEIRMQYDNTHSDLMNKKIISMPANMAKMIKSSMPEVDVNGMNHSAGNIIVPVIISDEMNEKINTALEILISYDIIEDGQYMVKMGKFSSSITHTAMENENIIILSTHFLDKDPSDIALAMFKEITYIEQGLQIGTSALEDYLFENWFNTFM